MLLLAGNEISEFRPLLSLAEKRSYRLHLPQIRGCRILASADGWLVTIDDAAAELHLFNPFTLAKHALPSITTLSVIHDVERDSITGRITGYTMPDDEELRSHDLEYMRLCFYHRAIIFHPQSDETLVFIIIWGGHFPALAFARLGEEYWTEIDNIPPYSRFTDVVLHKGHYYGVTSSGFCIALDLSSCSLPEEAVYEGPENARNTTLSHYLVESSDGDSLMHIRRHHTWSPERPQHDGVPPLESGVRKTQSFTVFLIDVIKKKMIKVDRLEQGTALFLGNNRSMLLRITQDLPELKENCIYFTDGAIPHHSRWRVAFFDMTTGNVEPLYSSSEYSSILSLRTSSPPVWLMLCHQY